MTCSYDYKREYQLGLETTILVKSYTVSILACFCFFPVPFLIVSSVLVISFQMEELLKWALSDFKLLKRFSLL